MDSPTSPNSPEQAPPVPLSNVDSQVSNNSEIGQSSTGKRNRDETVNSGAVNENKDDMARDDLNAEKENNRSCRFSSEDLLAPSAKFNKQMFQDACMTDIAETGAEQQALLEEYAQWEWVRISRNPLLDVSWAYT